MQKYLLFCQCAILLASFERIECPSVEFPIFNFGMVDIYKKVIIEGDTKTGRFIFKKKETLDDNRQFVIPFPDISPNSFQVEANNEKILSFTMKAAPDVSFNIKFKFLDDAEAFYSKRTLPKSVNLHWGRIYSNWLPAKIAFDDWGDDVGFKVLDVNDTRLHEGPYLFKRSDIDNALWSSSPDRLYLRNNTRMEDYFINFFTVRNADTFKGLFPNATYNGQETADYYFMR